MNHRDSVAVNHPSNQCTTPRRSSMSYAEKPKGSLLLAWQVKNKHCLVIGGGDVALSRVHHLVRAHAIITVVTGSGHVHPELSALHARGDIHTLLERDYQPSDLTLYENISQVPSFDAIDESNYAQLDHQINNEIFAIVCCAIDDYELSTKIYYQCKFLRLPVNIADKPPLCDFYFGSMFNRDNLQIMVSTNGKSPGLSRVIKDNIAKEFEDVDLNRAVENLGLIRSRLRELVVVDDDLVSIDTRMSWIKTLTDYFTLKQWSELNLIPPSSTPPHDNRHLYVDRIIKFFPEFPPTDFEEFKAVVFH